MPDNHDTCPCAAVEELKKIVERQGERLDEHQKRLYDGNTTFELLRRDIATLTAQMSEQTRRLGELLEKPAKRWDDAVKQVITFAIGAALGYIALRLGLN